MANMLLLLITAKHFKPRNCTGKSKSHVVNCIQPIPLLGLDIKKGGKSCLTQVGGNERHKVPHSRFGQVWVKRNQFAPESDQWLTVERRASAFSMAQLDEVFLSAIVVIHVIQV